ncbi:MAG: argininosuccinate lyase [Actinomycetota bacterium]|nr:argininosuccinate lyase [Actinomycetota bacterium]
MSGGVVWGGRFVGGPDPAMMEFTSSLGVDMRLLPQDVAVTKAHARTLVKAGLLEAMHLEAIDDALDELLDGWREGTIAPSPQDEDVHSFVERWLTESLGDVGKSIHAGRSRNDLVATDLRLWCKQASAELDASLCSLLSAIADVAEEQAGTVVPGYTHLQRAQPVSLGFHLLAHGFALARDRIRLQHAAVTADVSSLGAGALAGSTLGLDPEVAAKELGFKGTFDNATDAVADRDFAADLIYACALIGTHLSRLGEEVVLWTSSEFGFASLSDEWSTGSSMMPQKRNPDVAELIRGRAAGSISDLTGLLILLKGIPLAYNRDLQEDKGYVFSAVDRAGPCMDAMASLLKALRFKDEVTLAAASDGPLWATDVAEYLVRSGIPFRTAHEATGKFVGSYDPDAVSLEYVIEGVDVTAIVERGAATSVDERSGPGGPSKSAVLEQVRMLRERAG